MISKYFIEQSNEEKLVDLQFNIVIFQLDNPAKAFEWIHSFIIRNQIAILGLCMKVQKLCSLQEKKLIHNSIAYS